ncbi:MAG: type II secretion system protein N [Burkholderiaceae bacterium]
MARIVAFIVAAFLGVIAALVGFAPATLADWGLRQQTGGRLGLAETGGTVWDGNGRLVLIDISDRSADRRTVAGVAIPGRISWDIRMLPLLLGIVNADIRIDSMGEPVRLSGGLNEMRISAGKLSLPSVDLSRLGSPWNTIKPAGALALEWDGITLQRGAFNGRASIELREMASALTPVRPLGSYRIGVLGQGSSAKLDITTISGPLLLEGDGTWNSRQGVRFSALASAEERERTRLQTLLGLIGRRQGTKTLIKIGA